MRNGKATVAPKQKPGRSRQDFGTPPEFIAAVKTHLGIGRFGWDLAASEDNGKADSYIDEEINSLTLDWSLVAPDGWNWLNPPFGHIAPWAAKCAASKALCQVAMLVPAGVGANWFRDFVDGHAFVLFLNGRLSFDGIAPYPKDCMLCLYSLLLAPGYCVWNWRAPVII